MSLPEIYVCSFSHILVFNFTNSRRIIYPILCTTCYFQLSPKFLTTTICQSLSYHIHDIYHKPCTSQTKINCTYPQVKSFHNANLNSAFFSTLIKLLSFLAFLQDFAYKWNYCLLKFIMHALDRYVLYQQSVHLGLIIMGALTNLTFSAYILVFGIFKMKKSILYVNNCCMKMWYQLN